MVRRASLLLAAAVTAVGLAALPAAAAPPLNDDIESAAPLPTSAVVDLTEATVSQAEFDAAPGRDFGGQSVWFKETATQSGELRIRTEPVDGSRVRTYTNLSVYTSEVADPTPSDLSTFPWAYDYPVDADDGHYTVLSFPVEAGETYWITLGQNTGWEAGKVGLTSELLDRPANDAFADAVEISGASGSVAGDTAAATGEPGEPGNVSGHYSRRTIWYRWTAPADGDVEFRSIGQPATRDTRLGAYTGADLPSLSAVDTNNDASGGHAWSRIGFAAEAGTTYWLLVGHDSTASAVHAPGPLTLAWGDPSPPARVTVDAPARVSVGDRPRVTVRVTRDPAGTSTAAVGRIRVRVVLGYQRFDRRLVDGRATVRLEEIRRSQRGDAFRVEVDYWGTPDTLPAERRKWIDVR